MQLPQYQDCSGGVSNGSPQIYISTGAFTPSSQPSFNLPCSLPILQTQQCPKRSAESGATVRFYDFILHNSASHLTWQDPMKICTSALGPPTKANDSQF